MDPGIATFWRRLDRPGHDVARPWKWPRAGSSAFIPAGGKWRPAPEPLRAGDAALGIAHEPTRPRRKTPADLHQHRCGAGVLLLARLAVARALPDPAQGLGGRVAGALPVAAPFEPRCAADGLGLRRRVARRH